jgi:hypothetical protein
MDFQHSHLRFQRPHLEYGGLGRKCRLLLRPYRIDIE